MISVGSFSWEQVTLKDTDTTLIPSQCLVLWCSARWILCVKAQHACTLCPTFQERSDLSLPTSNKLKLWIVSGAGLIFFPFFFHGHQQTNRNGARCPSTAWGRTSSCEFPWPKSDSERLRAAGKITGEVTKWCWGEIRDRGKTETRRQESSSALWHF